MDPEYILPKGIGGFSGMDGMIYTLAHLGSMWNRSDLITSAEYISSLLPQIIKSDT